MNIITYKTKYGYVAKVEGTNKAVTEDTEELAIKVLKQTYKLTK